MSEQIDIAVDLGVVAPALPEILSVSQLVDAAPAPPPQIIDGILHQGCKMILGGTSKSNKSWCLLDLAMSVASGEKWWGRRCTKAAVLYINFELQVWAIAQRINSIASARPECRGIGDTLHLWNLRGHNADLSILRPKLDEQLAKHRFGLIILDPAYKVLGDRDENANGDIANLMNKFEKLAQSTGAAVVIAHHFAKGNSTGKEAMDRMSGAGAWTRDPDSILVMTPHEASGWQALVPACSSASRPATTVALVTSARTKSFSQATRRRSSSHATSTSPTLCARWDTPVKPRHRQRTTRSSPHSQ
jgi:RecA-family ATPase